jgi:4a-hydroxytetrahydrobiopterin dehydratase
MPAVTNAHVQRARNQLGDWTVAAGSSLGTDAQEVLRRDFHIATYSHLCHFVSQITELAEREGHHPSILLDWGRVRIETWTHKTWRVSKNDLILAAKINKIFLALPKELARNRTKRVRGSGQ